MEKPGVCLVFVRLGKHAFFLPFSPQFSAGKWSGAGINVQLWLHFIGLDANSTQWCVFEVFHGSFSIFAAVC